MIAFEFDHLTKDSPQLAEPWEIYLRIVADFRVVASGTTIYSEQQFCVVEFAIESQIWARATKETLTDFFYTSIEADEKGLVWIRRELDRWRVGSVFQTLECKETFSLREITRALDDYYQQLKESIFETPYTSGGTETKSLVPAQRAPNGDTPDQSFNKLRKLCGSFSNPGNTLVKSRLPRCLARISPSTLRKSVVTARSRS